MIVYFSTTFPKLESKLYVAFFWLSSEVKKQRKIAVIENCLSIVSGFKGLICSNLLRLSNLICRSQKEIMAASLCEQATKLKSDKHGPQANAECDQLFSEKKSDYQIAYDVCTGFLEGRYAFNKIFRVDCYEKFYDLSGEEMPTCRDDYHSWAEVLACYEKEVSSKFKIEGKVEKPTESEEDSEDKGDIDFDSTEEPKSDSSEDDKIVDTTPAPVESTPAPVEWSHARYRYSRHGVCRGQSHRSPIEGVCRPRRVP